MSINKQEIDSLSQMCVALFESEFENGRAYLAPNKSVAFISGKTFASYYLMSERLRNLSPCDYYQMREFLIDNFFNKTQTKKIVP